MNTLVNLNQTNEERKEKYHLCRSLGVSVSWSLAMRDWRLSKIDRLFKLSLPKTKRGKTIMPPNCQLLIPGMTWSQNNEDSPI